MKTAICYVVANSLAIVGLAVVVALIRIALWFDDVGRTPVMP